jgi:SMI1-KNR4 cell-wall
VSSFAVDQLLELVPPLEPIRRQIDWSTVERSLGFALPSDYKNVVESYGEGSFDEFLWVLHPTSVNPHLRLKDQHNMRRDILMKFEDAPVPPSQLICWAFTDNGDACYWLTREPRSTPDEWTTVANEARGPEWSISDLSASAWLVEVLAGRLKIPFFPEDFPSASPRFHPVID